MITAEHIKDRLHHARERIHQELDTLQAFLGDGFEVELSVNWLSVGTIDDPHRTTPTVEVTARIRP